MRPTVSCWYSGTQDRYLADFPRAPAMALALLGPACKAFTMPESYDNHHMNGQPDNKRWLIVAASEVISSEPCHAAMTAHVIVTIHATRVSSPRFGLTFSNSSKSLHDSEDEFLLQAVKLRWFELFCIGDPAEFGKELQRKSVVSVLHETACS